MPQPVTVDYLDGAFEIEEQEPSTIAEVVELIGEEAVRKSAIDDNRYRNKYPRVYRKVSQRVISDLSFPRAVKDTKTLKDGTVKNVLESEMDHIRRAISVEGGHNDAVAALFQEIAPAEPLYVKGERTGGGGKIAQDALDSANKFFAAGDEKVEDIATKIEGKIPGYKVGRDAENAVTPESLARGIMALNKHAIAAAKREAMSGLS